MKSPIPHLHEAMDNQIMRSLEWAQQTDELNSALFRWREERLVPACRGGQTVRFQMFADHPKRSDYDLGQHFILRKTVFEVDLSCELENGLIEVRATSVGLVEDMP